MARRAYRRIGAGDAKPGSAFGSGIFIQGTQSIGFAPEAGQTLTVSDVIADQSGSGGTGTLAGAGSVIINGSGQVDLDGGRYLYRRHGRSTPAR